VSTDFDLDRPWRLDERVSMRQERFGALLYHFGTRRLSFLKSQRVLDVVRALAGHPTARAACAAAGVPPAELPAVTKALAALAEAQMVTEQAVVHAPAHR
jgi:mycofactocin biosynthesis protein MftB